VCQSFSPTSLPSLYRRNSPSKYTRIVSCITVKALTSLHLEKQFTNFQKGLTSIIRRIKDFSHTLSYSVYLVQMGISYGGILRSFHFPTPIRNTCYCQLPRSIKIYFPVTK